MLRLNCFRQFEPLVIAVREGFEMIVKIEELNLLKCSCGEDLEVKDIDSDKVQLHHSNGVVCKCLKCKIKWKVSINFEEV